MQIVQELATDFRRSADELRYVPRDFLRILKNNWLALFATLVVAVALNRILLWVSVALAFIHPILSTLALPLASLAIMTGAIVAIWIIERDLIHLKFQVTQENRLKYLLHSTGALILPFIAVYVSSGWFNDDYLDQRMPLTELKAGNINYLNSLQIDPSYDERSTLLVFSTAIILRLFLKWTGLARKNVLCTWALAYCEVLWSFTLASWIKEVISGTATWPQSFHFWDWWEYSKSLFSIFEPVKDGLIFLFSTVLLLPVAWITFVQLVLRKVIIVDENSPLFKTKSNQSSAARLTSQKAVTFFQVLHDTVILLVALGPLAVTLICLYFNIFWIPEPLWRWLLDFIIGPITDSSPRFYIKYSLIPFGKVFALGAIVVLSGVTADRCQGNIINRLRKPQWL